MEEYATSREAALGEERLLAALKKREIEKALAGELTHHLGYKKGQKPSVTENQRSSYSAKSVIGGRTDGDRGEIARGALSRF